MILTVAQSWWPVLLLFALVIPAAAVIARFVPAYRREMAVETETRMLALDGLRGVLCFAVMLHHAAMTLQQPFLRGQWQAPLASLYILLGRTSVAVFFCITGFLFWGRLLRTAGKLNWPEFFRGRLLRIMPLYLFTALIVAGIVLPKLAHIHASPMQFGRFLLELSTGGALPWHVVTTPAGSVYPEDANAGVHWSLRYEWLFYAALPLLAFFATSARRTVVLFVGAALLIVACALKRPLPLTMFPVGMLAAHATRSFSLATELRKPRYAFVVLAAIALTIAFVRPSTSALTRGLLGDPASLLATVLMIFIFTPLACGNSMFGLLTLPALRLMGVISFSVYLLHGIVLYLSRPWLRSLARGLDDPNFTYWLGVSALAIGVLIAASLTYQFVERPFIELDRRLRHKKRDASDVAIAPSATSSAANG